MSIFYFLFTTIAYMTIIMSALFFIAKKMDMWYSKKDKPAKTSVICPFWGRPLKDFEVFNGHCISCHRKEICKGHVTAQVKTNSK